MGSRLLKKVRGIEKVANDEGGFTLIEVLGAIAVLGTIIALLVGVFLQIMTIFSVQSQQIEFQQVSNNIVLCMKEISQKEKLYEQAGYLGKYVGVPWEDAHVIKMLSKTEKSDGWLEVAKMAQGTNPIALTDINDNLNQAAVSFHVKDSTVKMKILQQKNEYEITKTIYSLPNYRDTFSIQTTALILFYRDEIDFSNYYDEITGFWDYQKIKQLDNVLYSRETVFTYRDQAKARGEVPGDGRW